MDYVNVPTTIFTPLEYGTCGYSEEDAKAKFGDNLPDCRCCCCLCIFYATSDHSQSWREKVKAGIVPLLLPELCLHSLRDEFVV